MFQGMNAFLDGFFDLVSSFFVSILYWLNR